MFHLGAVVSLYLFEELPETVSHDLREVVSHNPDARGELMGQSYSFSGI